VLTLARTSYESLRAYGLQAWLLAPCLWLSVILAIPFTYHALRIVSCDATVLCTDDIPCWGKYKSTDFVFILMAVIDLSVFVVGMPFGLFGLLVARMRFLRSKVFSKQPSQDKACHVPWEPAEFEAKVASWRAFGYQDLPFVAGSPGTALCQASPVATRDWSEFLYQDPSALATLYRANTFEWLLWTPCVMFFSVVLVIIATVTPPASMDRHAAIVAVSMFFAVLSCCARFAPRGPILAAYRLAFLHPLALAMASMFRDAELRNDGEPGVAGVVAIAVSTGYVASVVVTAFLSIGASVTSTRADKEAAERKFIERGLPVVAETCFIDRDKKIVFE